MASGYVVAVDGGNSKTDVVVADVSGGVLARVSGPGTRSYLDGVDATADSIAGLVRCARGEAGLALSTRPAAGSFLLANVDSAVEEEAMRAALTARDVAARLEVGNDTISVLRAGSSRGWGIAVACGAGINAIGRHPDGRLERFLGIGALSGDWGGGEGLVTAAIGASVRAGDGRGPATALREQVAVAFGADAEAIAVAAHRGELSEATIGTFAPAVFATATAGDPVAVSLVDRLADEIAAYVRALVARMQLADTPVDIVLGGGVLQAAQAVLMTRVAAGIASAAPAGRLLVLDVAPVAGALVSALEIAGAGAVERVRARSAFQLVGP